VVERDPNAPTERTERACRILADWCGTRPIDLAWRQFVDVFNEHDIKIAELENELESLRPKEGR
jgi:hypothetical protein